MHRQTGTIAAYGNENLDEVRAHKIIEGSGTANSGISCMSPELVQLSSKNGEGLWAQWVEEDD